MSSDLTILHAAMELVDYDTCVVAARGSFDDEAAVVDVRPVCTWLAWHRRGLVLFVGWGGPRILRQRDSEARYVLLREVETV